MLKCGGQCVCFHLTDSYHDSPPRNQRFSLPLLDTKRDTFEKKIPLYFLVGEGLAMEDVEVSRDAMFQEIYGRGLVLKPTISLKESWGGYRRNDSLVHVLSISPPAHK